MAWWMWAMPTPREQHSTQRERRAAALGREQGDAPGRAPRVGCLKGLTLRPALGCTFHQARGTAQRKPGGSWVLIRAGVKGRRDLARERWKQENIPE